MARYTGPSCKLCRREGQKLFLKGERCYGGKCALERRAYAPGQHGQGRKKSSTYGLQLREKQKAKRFYGLQETQFRNYFEKAARKPGITGDNLLIMLETRLDNTVFRMGFASSRKEARQLVTHGHFTLNGKKVDIASYLVTPGDVIGLRERSRGLKVIKEAVEGRHHLPAYIEFNEAAMEGKFIRLPERAELSTEIDEKQIVEFYSR